MDVCMARDTATVTGRVTPGGPRVTSVQPVTCGKRLKSDGTCRVHGTKTT